MSEIGKKRESLWVGIAGLFVALIALFVVGSVLSRDNGQAASFGQVSALILVGFASFIILLNVLSFSAYVTNTMNSSQPFALPEGSIRAILTLSLIVLVGVLASYLITSGNRSPPTQKLVLQHNLTSDQANAFVATNPKVDGQIAIQALEEKGAATLYDVVSVKVVENKLSEDISKQILTMLSTILAAMIGFYFGARTDSGPAAPDQIKPSADANRAVALRQKAKAALDALPDTAETKKRRTELAGFVATLGELQTNIDSWDLSLAFPGASDDVKSRAQKAKEDARTAMDDIEKRLSDAETGDGTPTP